MYNSDVCVGDLFLCMVVFVGVYRGIKKKIISVDDLGITNKYTALPLR